MSILGHFLSGIEQSFCVFRAFFRKNEDNFPCGMFIALFLLLGDRNAEELLKNRLCPF